jgi:hypothetical protein
MTACSLWVDRGGAIANDIRRQEHPLIADVVYSGDNDDSGPNLSVILVNGATHEDAVTVLCDVVTPAVERGDPPDLLVYSVEEPSGAAYVDDRTACP